MITLLKIEWLKIKKYKPFWFILIFLLILFPLATIGAGEFFKNIVAQLTQGQPDIVRNNLPSPFDYKYVFLTSAWINNGLNIAWGMLLILMIGTEFQNRTLRQNVIDGQNRSDIITSKLFLILIFSLISATLIIISGIISAAIYSRSGTLMDGGIPKVFGISFVAAVMQLLFAMLFGFFIKRPAFAVIIYLGYTIFIENVIVYFIFRGLLGFQYGRLFLTQAADELTVSPERIIAPDNVDSLHTAAPWIACTIYAALILFVLYRYINKTILK